MPRESRAEVRRWYSGKKGKAAMSDYRRLVAAAGLLALAIPAGAVETSPVTDLAFAEASACRMNEIPLGQPARVEGRRDRDRVEIKVAANFGCSTTAGKARAEAAPDEIRLYADTILPDFPTPACKCTRHLQYRFTSGTGARRVVFYKDGRVEGEGTLDPQ